MARNILLEISAVDPDNSPFVVVRACAASSGINETTLDGKYWAPTITAGPVFSYDLWTDGPKPLDVSYGSISLNLDPDSGANVWPKYSYEGALGTIWVGDPGTPFSSYRKLWTGTVGPLVRNGSEPNGQLTLYGSEADLAVDLLTETYSGTGGANGSSGLIGKFKPYAVGACVNVEPILIDPVKLVFQYHGYGSLGVSAVYENAYPLGDPAANVTTYAALIALDLKAGQWAACPSLGMFRLKSQPGGKLTADVGTVATAGDVMRSLILKAGLSATRVHASITGTTERNYSFFATEQATVYDVVRDAAFAASKFVITNADGAFCVAPYASTKAATPLTSNRTSLPLVRPDTIVEEPKSLPAYKVRVGHTRVWAVHSTSDISPALGDGGEILAAIAAAAAAQERAELARAAASLAIERLDDAVKDSILDRTEKRFWLSEFEGATGEFQALVNEGQAQGATVEAQALAAAYTALNAYLTALNPALTDLTQDTPIDPATFKARFVGYYAARQDVLTALVRIARAKIGQPTSLAELSPIDAAKLEEAVKDAQNAVIGVDKVRTQLPDLVGPLLLTPIDNLSALHLKGSSATLKASKALSDKNAVAITQIGVRIDKTDEVVAEQVTQLTSRIKKGEDTIEAGFLEVNRTIANTKEALTENITLTIAKYGESASASMVEERRVRSAKDQALAEDIDQMAIDLTTSFGDKLTGQINDVKKIIADEDGIIGTRIEELGVKLVEDVAGEKLAREAAIQTVEKAIVDADGVTAGRIETISSSFQDLGKYVDGVAKSVNEISGVIQTNQETSANANEARAKETRDLIARLDGMNYAQLQESFNTYASKVDGVGAEYTLKVQTTQDGEKVVAGMGIAIEDGVSAIAFLADSFRIAVPGTTATKQVFYADGQGIYMPDVRVDKLAANSITINEIAPGLSRSPRYVANDIMIPGYEVVVIETPFFSVGFNNDATGTTENGSSLATLSFTHDGSQVVDTAADIRVYVDTGGGYQLLRTSRSGIATKDGNTVWSLKFTDTIAITASGAARVKITAQGVPFGNSPRNSGTYARSPEINIISIGR